MTPAGLDIRLPIGLLFAVLGALLVVFGLLSSKDIYESSLGININLWWGLVMLLFGGCMSYFGRRGSSAGGAKAATAKAADGLGE